MTASLTMIRPAFATSVWLGAWTLLTLPSAAWAWEVDCRACNYCRGKGDILPALELRIHAHMRAKKSGEEIALAEGGLSLLHSPIEDWAKGLPEAVRPDRSLMRYRGSDLPDGPFLCAYSPSVKVNGICIGTDKLAHLFQQGWEYYTISVRDGRGDALARRYGEWLEGVEPRESYSADEPYFRRQQSGRVLGHGSFGRVTSGIISHADLEANIAGLRFYRDLAAGRFTSISNYISPALCEEHNPNQYTPAMKAIVERNERDWLSTHPAKSQSPEP